MRLETDPALRKALYGLYVALFDAKCTSPSDFHASRVTTIQTAIMGVENVGWRVVGITKEALDRLATVDFQKKKLPWQLCRGHIVNRVETTRRLFERETPIELEEYFRVFLDNDRTVIMLKEQNDHTKSFPEFIEIDNADAGLFPNGSLISWKHRKKEREYLRRLYAERRARESEW